MIPILSGRIGSITPTATMTRDKNGSVKANVSYSITFQLEDESKIILSDGSPISQHLIKLKFVCGQGTNSEIESGPSGKDIGFLMCTKDAIGDFKLSGNACWPSSETVFVALQYVKDARISILFSNIEWSLDNSHPHVWLPDEEGALYINSVTLGLQG